MAKLFVVSDVHGYYDEMRAALEAAGFDENNKEHWLIGCGDYIDRGEQPQEVINYLENLPRKILIKGNHEELLKELLDSKAPTSYDFQNGTFATIVALGEVKGMGDLDTCYKNTWGRIKNFYNNLLDYFETENYIFVHSWIPTIADYTSKYSAKSIGPRAYDANWRNGNWDNARWGNPFLQTDLNETGKTIVFGHWHTSWARYYHENKPQWRADSDFSPYHGEGYIGIDGCTAFTHKVNVLVLEDNFIEEIKGQKN